ncbi:MULTISPECIES: hypothetical protein [Mycobacteroides]|uniref:Secreted protein n=1 Tax=Mycobacteroides immunogenum TaxID=83262 RepID=A0A7V8RWJ6_9MYCO|nr:MULTISPECIES: hypothetical protein [Mycobacteroides]AMT69258.1 hypothetical protein ABG82_01660 [Mycobacteroides immunogenum]ANO02289.1 hypothetical protein BAB75_01660 [Mycobacteroides immunogenum]KIU38255.1 hypothetical protein TL11_23330 [Mycobacteroides immunogenum]KPG11225.1 hypothetical protein AN908_12615 [Mycobacteroides immunogenum]KPG12556.1 hypothetical protein AN909_07045 [Mycobacteroides immunogenum]
MKSLVITGITTLALLAAPQAVAQADPSGWCQWNPELGSHSCDYIVSPGEDEPVHTWSVPDWCQWTPELDTSQCGLVVGVPPHGTLISEPGDWSQPEIRTKD